MNGEGDLHVKREGAVCTLVIDNPGKHNALTLECLIKMAATFDRLARDDVFGADVPSSIGKHERLNGTADAGTQA